MLIKKTYPKKACLTCTLNNIDFFTILIEELRTIRPKTFALRRKKKNLVHKRPRTLVLRTEMIERCSIAK